MNAIAPIYTAENCRAAYQLNWALAVFWREPTAESEWLAELQSAVESDGIRVLRHRFVRPGVSQFVLSTRPALSPQRLVQLVKGRLQLTLGCNVSESPAEVALSYMNNLAYACGMKRLFAFGFYVGTFGEYDLGVTWL